VNPIKAGIIGTGMVPDMHRISFMTFLALNWKQHAAVRLKGDGPNPVTGEDGLAAVRICDACRQSALEDKWVKVQNRMS
jgi:hypothetical protein